MLKPFVSEEQFKALPAHFQAEYAKGQDGRYVLAVEQVDGWALENVQGLRSALSSERTTAATLKQQIEAFKDLDPVAARAALQKLAELGDISKLKGEDKVNAQIAAVKGELETKLRTETESRDGRIKHLTAEINRMLVESAARSALQTAGVTDSIDLLLPHVMSSLRAVEENNRFVTRVVDQAGNVRITGQSGKTDPMDATEFVGLMRDDKRFKVAFPAPTKGGTGAPTGGSGGTGSEKHGAALLAEAFGAR